MKTQVKTGMISKGIVTVILVIVLATGFGQTVKLKSKLKSGSENFKTQFSNSYNRLKQIR
ncbi:MAG: hypothetical protein WAQ28_16250 [Bacteroidia bacterium]|jgi:hypothetical protein